MNVKFLAVSFLSATRLDDVSLSGDTIHSFQLVGLPKIPIVFNIGQINCTISGRLSERPTSGQKNGLISGRFSEKSVLARNTGFFMAVIGKGRLGRRYGLACAACFE